MKRLPFTLCAQFALFAAQFALAQDTTPRAPAPLIYQPHPMAQALYWLTSDQMQKELEILPEQKEKLDKLRTEMQTKLSEASKSFDTKSLKLEDHTKYHDAMNAVNEEAAKKVEEILRPLQTKRLKQILTQQRLQTLGYGGGASTLAAADLAKELGITEQQREELKKREEEIRLDIQKKTQEFQKKLQEEAREKFFSVLTPVQRKKLQELEGDRFEWKSTPWQAGAGGRVRVIEKKPEGK